MLMEETDADIWQQIVLGLSWLPSQISQRADIQVIHWTDAHVYVYVILTII